MTDNFYLCRTTVKTVVIHHQSPSSALGLAITKFQQKRTMVQRVLHTKL